MNSKNKIILIIICMLFVIIIGFCVFKIVNKEDPYESVISKINNKESFAFILSKSDSFSMKKTFEYYSDVYSIPIVFLTEDTDNKYYKEVLKFTGQKVLAENGVIFQLVDKGNQSGVLIGTFDEFYIKRLLINFGYIDKAYEDVDNFINSSFNDYYKKDKTYNVLYVGEDDSNYYEYRKLLVKNKIPSLVVLLGFSNIDTIEYLEKETSIKSEDELPVLIKIRKNKIIDSYKNVSLDSLVSKCKEG